jgi:hypothetical protein
MKKASKRTLPTEKGCAWVQEHVVRLLSVINRVYDGKGGGVRSEIVCAWMTWSTLDPRNHCHEDGCHRMQ